MTSVQQSVDVAVPVRTAYNQWTQFEQFPRFMQGVQRVQQQSPTLLHWETRIAGVEREFDAEISEQIPDERIAWHAIAGPHQAGVVTFHRLDEEHTRIMLQLDFDPSGMVEQVGDRLGFVHARIDGDLKNFKRFIEARGAETGAWRGEVAPPAVPTSTEPYSTEPYSAPPLGPNAAGQAPAGPEQAHPEQAHPEQASPEQANPEQPGTGETGTEGIDRATGRAFGDLRPRPPR